MPATKQHINHESAKYPHYRDRTTNHCSYKVYAILAEKFKNVELAMDSQQHDNKKKYDSGVFKKPQLASAQAPSESTTTTQQIPLTIGASPVPGIKLQKILRGHTQGVNRIDLSPD